MVGTKPLFAAHDKQVAAQIAALPAILKPAVGGLAHYASAVRAPHKAAQNMDLSACVLLGAKGKHILNLVKCSPVDDCLMRSIHADPVALRDRNHDIRFVTRFFCLPLYHHAGIDLIPQDPVYGHSAP